MTYEGLMDPTIRIIIEWVQRRLYSLGKEA